MRRAFGYAFLVVAVVGWSALLALPVLGVSFREAVALGVGLLVTAELAFLLGVMLLGREAWTRIKRMLRLARGRAPGEPTR